MGIVITNNAYEAAWKNMGIKKKAVERIAMRAFMDGINYYETSGQLRRYLEETIEFSQNMEVFFKIYGENVYKFGRRMQYDGSFAVVLITVFRIPNELRNQVRGTFKKCMSA